MIKISPSPFLANPLYLVFNEVLGKIYHHLEPSEKGAKNAANNTKGPGGEARLGVAICPLLKLAITLRMLAGGSYLDIAFGYEVGSTSVYYSFWQVLKAINTEYDNIQFPFDDEARLRDLEKTFTDISGKKRDEFVFPGTVAAGDGVVFRMLKPVWEDVDGAFSNYYVRKGFYAMNMQAFVDGKCRFLNISMIACSSSHDSTAYTFCGMSRVIKEGKLPLWAHVVLDEAYMCDVQELSPWRARQMQGCTPAKKAQRDAFNYFLSLHRQVVERAFGILVARWGIFWRALRFSIAGNSLVIVVCCKLHNLCVDAYGASSTINTEAEDTVHKRGNAGPADVTVLMTDAGNLVPGKHHVGSTRDRLTEHLSSLDKLRPDHSLNARFKRVQNTMCHVCFKNGECACRFFK